MVCPTRCHYEKKLSFHGISIFLSRIGREKSSFPVFYGENTVFYHTPNHSVVEYGIQHVCTTYVCTHLHVFAIHRVVYDFKEVTRSIETIEK